MRKGEISDDVFVKKILTIAGMNGVVEYKDVKLIYGNEKYKITKLKEMEKRGWIKVRSVNGYRRIRLNHVGKRYEEYKKWIEPLSKEVCIKSCESTRTQNQRTMKRKREQSEVLIMCNEGRIAVYPWEKAQLGRSVNSEAAYYTSLEIKEENNIRQAKLDKYILQRCRATGTIYGPDRIYNVYNTERGLIEIHEDDEEVYCGLVQELGKETFYQGIHQLVDGIILSMTMTR